MATLPTSIAAATALPSVDRDWLAVAAATCGLIFSVGTLTIYSFGVFVHPLAAEFHWSRTALAGAVAVSQIGLAFASPICGSILDRFGPRPVLLSSVVFLSLIFGLLSLLTPPIWHLYLAFFAIPFLAAGDSPIGYSAVLVRLFDRRLGLALGFATMGVGLGAVILPPLAEWLVHTCGWRDAYLIIGGLSLVVGLPSAFIATRNARGPAVRPARSADTAVTRLGPLLRTRRFVTCCALFSLIGLTTIGLLGQIVPMMIDRGFAPAQAARVAALTGLAALLGRGIIGWVLDRVDARKVIAAVAIFACVSFLLLALSQTRPASYLAVVLLGGAVGAEVNFIAYLTRRQFPEAVFGRLYGLEFGAYIVSGGLGQLVLTASLDHLNSYQPALLLFAFLIMIGCLLTFALPGGGESRGRVSMAHP